jgi:hypothetical protein
MPLAQLQQKNSPLVTFVTRNEPSARCGVILSARPPAARVRRWGEPDGWGSQLKVAADALSGFTIRQRTNAPQFEGVNNPRRMASKGALRWLGESGKR